MRRLIIVLLMLLTVPLFATDRGVKWEARLLPSLLVPADAGYRETYGRSVFLPRLELGYVLFKGLGVWAGFGWVDKTGQGRLTGIACDSLQRYVSLGVSYVFDMTSYVDLRLAAAPMIGSYREEAGIWKVSGNAIGFDLSASLCWAFSKSLGVEGHLGFLTASENSGSGGSFALGGFWFGSGIVCRF